MRGRRSHAVLIALWLSLAGCSEVLVQDDGALSYAEVVALASQLGLETFGAAQDQDGSLTDAAPTSSPAAIETVTVSYDVSRPCLLGGSVASSGTVTITWETDPDRAVVDVESTDVHDRCVFLADGTHITVTGDPDVTALVHVATLESELDGLQSASLIGAVLWETDDDRNGRCEIEILVEVDPDADHHTANGRFCAHEFDVTVSGA